MTVEITTQPERRVAAIRHVGPYNQVGDAFGRLGAIAGQAGLFTPDAMMVGLYHDDPQTTPAADLRADAGITVSAAAKLPAGLTEQRIPAGQYARATHVGSYEGLPDMWARLMGDWLPKSGHRVGTGVSHEVYRNNPMDTPTEKLITEIYIPIAPR